MPTNSIMTQIKERLDEMDDDDERATLLPELMEELTQLSKNQIIEFQNKWAARNVINGTKRSYHEFMKAQNKELLGCIGMELTTIGDIARQREGKIPLTEERVRELLKIEA
jgi:hypothetical protein